MKSINEREQTTLLSSASQASVGHSTSQTSVGGSSTHSDCMMYDAQVLSPVMSTNSVPLLGQSESSSITKQSSKQTQEEHVVRRGETSAIVQQKSETFRYGCPGEILSAC